jgi:cysteinyl-tRNA synthetase
VTVHSHAGAERFGRGTSFEIERLGPFRLPQVAEGIPPAVWATAQAHQSNSTSPRSPGEEVTALMAQREQARARGDWDGADRLRKQIASMGWSVIDSAEGPRLEPNPET